MGGFAFCRKFLPSDIAVVAGIIGEHADTHTTREALRECKLWSSCFGSLVYKDRKLAIRWAKNIGMEAVIKGGMFDMCLASRCWGEHFVAVDDANEVVGVCGYIPVPKYPAEYFVGWTYVKKGRQGEGIGSALLEFTISQLKTIRGRIRFPESIYVDTSDTTSNKAAINFYLKRGFVRYATLKPASILRDEWMKSAAPFVSSIADYSKSESILILRRRLLVTYAKQTDDVFIDTSGDGVGGGGWKLRSSRNIEKGGRVFVNFPEKKFILAKDSSVTLQLAETGESIELKCEVHAVPLNDKQWVLEVPSCFMQHACAPSHNTISLRTGIKRSQPSPDKFVPDDERIEFDETCEQITTMEVRKGELLTTDYALDYMDDCNDWQFSCDCQAASCRKVVRNAGGIKTLLMDPNVKRSLLACASYFVRVKCKSDKEKVEDELNDCVNIIKTELGIGGGVRVQDIVIRAEKITGVKTSGSLLKRASTIAKQLKSVEPPINDDWSSDSEETYL